MRGYEVISTLKKHITDNDILVGSTGNISREVYHHLPKPQVYLRGSMGLAVPVGLGLALSNPKRNVIVISGDGSFLMGLGSATTAAYYKLSNLKILVLDNQKYFTTGGQETVSTIINYSKFLESLQIKENNSQIASPEKIDQILKEFIQEKSFIILHLNIIEGKEDLSNIPWHPKEITSRLKLKLTY